MKKSTKLITTAIALALVIAAMVVGIYAATSASASITASVSWTATAGLEFNLYGWTCFSKEDYEGNGGQFSDVSSHIMDTISINTRTTNQEAAGINKNFNATFIDDSDDGVNNPRSIYYCYNLAISQKAQENFTIKLKKYPTSNENIKVEWNTFLDGNTPFWSGSAIESLNYSSVVPTILTYSDSDILLFPMIVIKLTVLTPDISIPSFDAGITFDFS